ncbi:hypothetical protein COW46_00875 [Candidatus Gracilibacteria bacterium CG17_big_fil_post_rev_8_21_14_2_50_48_13]|nr:MAG: hypothetical protein COW46_00875 [Candidatus Gracilibacteria bacterium CG17_big_fil_post_rev_8_21_14_2_50_48_13]
MNGIQFAALVRTTTNQDSATFPDARMVAYTNAALEELVPRVESVNEGFFTMEYYHDLVADQRLYTFPDDMMNRMEKLAIKFETWDGYKWCEEDRLSMTGLPADEATIRAQYSDSRPKFWLRREGLYILTGSAIPDATDGIQFWAKKYPNDISATTLAQSFDMSIAPAADGVGIPRLMHRVLAMRVSIMYKEDRDRPLPLTQAEQNFEFHVQKMLDSIGGQNLERSITPRFPYDDGSQY